MENPDQRHDDSIFLTPDSRTRLFKSDDGYTYTHPEGSQATFDPHEPLRVIFFDPPEMGPQMLLTQGSTETQVELSRLPDNIPMFTVSHASDFLKPIYDNSMGNKPTPISVDPGGEKPTVRVNGDNVGAPKSNHSVTESDDPEIEPIPMPKGYTPPKPGDLSPEFVAGIQKLIDDDDDPSLLKPPSGGLRKPSEPKQKSGRSM